MTPYLAQPDNFALFMLLGALVPVGVRARAARRSAGVRAGRRLRRPRVPVAQRRRAAGRSRSRSPFLSTLVRRPGRAAHRLAAGGRLRASGSSCSSCRPGCCASWRSFGSLSPVRGERPHPVDHRLPPALQRELARRRSRPSWARASGSLLASRVGGLVAALGIFATMPLLAVPGAVHAHRRVAAPARHARSCRGSSTPSRCSPSARCCSRCTCRTARSSTRRSRCVPHAYLLALLGHRGRGGGGRAPAPALEHARATRVFTAMVVAVVAGGRRRGHLLTLERGAPSTTCASGDRGPGRQRRPRTG